MPAADASSDRCRTPAAATMPPSIPATPSRVASSLTPLGTRQQSLRPREARRDLQRGPVLRVGLRLVALLRVDLPEPHVRLRLAPRRLARLRRILVEQLDRVLELLGGNVQPPAVFRRSIDRTQSANQPDARVA